MKAVSRAAGFILIFSFILPACRKQEARAERVRQPARAGQFYPGTEQELRSVVHAFLQTAEPQKIDGPIRGLWAPHAGYVFSGAVAANAYRAIRDQNLEYDAVILLGPAHTMPLSGASIGDWDAYATPLGKVAVQRDLAERLIRSSPLIRSVRSAHLHEHSLEVQLPFLQTVLPGAPVVPILTGRLSHDDCRRLADVFVHETEGLRVLFVASSDMSHYPDYENAVAADARVLDAVRSGDTEAILRLDSAGERARTPGLDCALCGPGALITAMLAARYSGAKAVHVLPYRNSGDVSGDRDRVVGYGAALFYQKGGEMPEKKSTLEDIPFTPEEKKKLFAIARQSILAALRRQPMPVLNASEPHLNVRRGVFVTLTNRGRLRGCLGNFQPTHPLYEMVSRMAAASATQDYRFAANPVTESELDRIEIKISILSELRKIDSIDEIEVGRHGIWVKQGARSGTYLPEVATDMGWTREQFLTSCCAEKAGLAPDAWKTGAEIYVYTSQILSEKETS